MFWSVPYCRMLRSRINSDGESRETCKPERMVVELACVRACMQVSCRLAGCIVCIMNTTDEMATQISKGDVAVLQTSNLCLFWHDLCEYKV